MSVHAVRRGTLAAAYRPPGAPAGASDDFNRADGALGTSSSGHVWTHTGWTVASNRCKPPTSGGYQVATLDAGTTDVAVEATLNPSASPDWGLAARVADANNFVFFDIVWVVDHWLCRVFQRVGGSFTGITTLVNPVPQLADNVTPFTARLEVNGSGGEAFIEGASQGTFTGLDSGLLTPTSHGLVGNDIQSATFDDLTITAL